MALTRIVKMHFAKEKLQDFLTHFKQAENEIRSFPGCKHMEAFQCIDEPNVVITYSLWDSEEVLENYRNSSLFKSVWAKTKVCFDQPAQAWSLQSLC